MIIINNYYNPSYGSTELAAYFIITVLLKEEESQFPALQSNIIKDSESLAHSHLGNRGAREKEEVLSNNQKAYM